MFHNDSWRDVNKPPLCADQVARLLVIWEPWFREEFAPRRKPVTVPKAKVGRRPRASTSVRIPQSIRDDVLDRDERLCQRCGLALEGQRYSLHHRRRRQVGGHTMANLVSLCGSGTTGCHGEIGSYRNDAVRDGWIVPDGATPERWPVKRYGRSCEQPGDLWVPVRWHPRQIELGVTLEAA
jgi:hypothetical protein